MSSPIVALLATASHAQRTGRGRLWRLRDRSAGSARAHRSGPLQIHSVGMDDVRTIDVSGELDIAGRDLLVGYCCAGTEPSVVVNMSRLVFMDCCGYAAIVQAQLGLDVEGRTLMFVGASGQPARLLHLIEDL